MFNMVTFAGFADEAGKSIEEQILATKEAGWSSIEVRNADGENFTEMSDDMFARNLEKLRAAGIGIAGFGSKIANWGRPIDTDFQVDVDELRRAGPRMREVGCRIIRIMSYPNRQEDPLPNAAWKREVFRRLRELAVIAEGEGVILGHENCDGYGGLGPDESLDMLDAVGNPALKLIFDTGNAVFHGQDSRAFYEQVKDAVVHIHVKDARRDEKGELVACYPDEGLANNRATFADLKARGYDGYISIEPHMAAVVHLAKDVEDAEAARAIYVEYARRTEALWKEA